MSTPSVEGGQDYNDILGFPGDEFKDKDDVNPTGYPITLPASCVYFPQIQKFPETSGPMITVGYKTERLTTVKSALCLFGQNFRFVLGGLSHCFIVQYPV